MKQISKAGRLYDAKFTENAVALEANGWNQGVKREPACGLMVPIELKKSVMVPAGRSTDVGQHRFGCDVGDGSAVIPQRNELWSAEIAERGSQAHNGSARECDANEP